MNWFYAENGDQRGPIAPAEWDALVASGAITDTTLVWNETLPQWTAWGQLRTADGPPVAPMMEAPPMVDAAAGAPLDPGQVRCAECGQVFPVEDTIQLSGRPVCGSCKPRFLQRLSEGAAVSAAGGRFATYEEVMTRDYPISVGRAWDRSLAEFKKEPWMLLAATLVMGLLLLISLGSGMVAGLVIPLAQNVLQLFVGGQLTAGLYLIFLNRLRGEPVNLSTGLKGFGPRYWQLTLFQLVQTGAMLGFGIIIALGAIPFFFFGIRASTAAAADPGIGMIAAIIAGALVITAGVFIMFYYLIGWMFALPLILDKGLDFWPAMQLSRTVIRRHIWRFSWLLLFTSLFTALGALLCGVGILLTGTLAMLMLCCVYEDMFGDLAPQSRT